MRKTILIALGAAVFAASAVQAAAATEHHRVHRTVRAHAQISEPVRNANAYLPAPAPADEARWSNYGLSAPAGR